MNNFDNINWSQLGYPNIENILEGLKANEEDVRDRAYEGLVDYYLDNVYPVCLYLVPHFIILLKDSNVQDKDRIMWFLQLWVGGVKEAQKARISDERLSLIFAEIARGRDVYLLLKKSDNNDYSTSAIQLLNALTSDS